MDNILIVVIPKSAAELFVVHFRFVFTDAPSSGHLNVNEKNKQRISIMIGEYHQEGNPSDGWNGNLPHPDR